MLTKIFQFYQIRTFKIIGRCKLPPDEVSMYIVTTKSLTLELRTVCQLILKAQGTTLQSVQIKLVLNVLVNSVIVGTFSGHLVQTLLIATFNFSKKSKAASVIILHKNHRIIKKLKVITYVEQVFCKFVQNSESKKRYLLL